MRMTIHDIENRFSYHPADTTEKQEAHTAVRHHIGEAALVLDDLLPDGREKSLAVTKLEEAMFWANAALARPQISEGDQSR